MPSITESQLRAMVRNELKQRMLTEQVKSKTDLKQHFLSTLDKIGEDVDTVEIQALAQILDKAVEIAATKNLKTLAPKVIAAMGQKAGLKQ
jgi:hypothetical protein